MSLGMHLELKADQRMEISTTPSMELTQKLITGMREVRGKDHSPESGLAKTLAAVVSAMKASKTNVAAQAAATIEAKIEALTKDPIFQQELLGEAGSVAHGNFDPKRMVASYLYEKIFLTEQSFPIAMFMDAVLEREKLDKQKEALLKMSDARHLAELNKALDSASTCEQLIKSYSEITNLLLKIQVEEQPVLLDFLYDVHVLSRLDFVISERLAKRFCDSLQSITAKSKVEKFETAAINSVSEYVLISLGIIKPEIFLLQKKELSPKETSAFNQLCHDLGIAPEALKQRYNLQASGTLFWNRWFVTDQKPSRITDEMVRSFTKTIRKDAADILEAMEFERVFDALRSVIPPLKKEKDKEEIIEETLNGAVAEMLTNDAFQKLIIRKIQTKPWRDAIANFFYTKV